MRQWRVVDTNFLRSPLLDCYFRADPGNQIIFTDHGFMELYKGPELKNLWCSLAIVSRYPLQVVVLKSTREIVALQSSSDYAASLAAFVDRDQTCEFRRFCEDVRRAVNGSEPELAERLLAKSRLANNCFARAHANAGLTGQAAVRAVAASHDPGFLKQLRTRAPISSDGGEAITKGILLLAAVLFRDHPDVGRIPSGRELPGSLVFRYALAAYLLALRWISDGGIDSVSPGTLANDLVDVTHVTYATYFDGLLSVDKRLNGLYEETDWFLRNVFITTPIQEGHVEKTPPQGQQA